jgi:hypothetical protein
MRTVVQTTLADLPRMAEYSGPWVEFYIKELVRLDQWRGGVPHLPHNRVWCGLNSYNMPGEFAEPWTMLSLGGAGDLLILSQFIHDIGGVDYVTAYDDRASVLGKGIRCYPIERSGPTDMRLGQIRHRYDYVANHPAAMQFLLQDAKDEGWDHYDWFGLMLGIVPKEKWVHVAWDESESEEISHPAVAVHLKASTKDRSIDHIPQLPGVTYIPVGDGYRSYHQTYRLLQQVDAVVAVDSVVLHMAAVARGDLPVLGIYTSTPTTWAGPRRSGMDVIQIDKSDTGGVKLWLKEKMSEVR